MRLFFIVNSQFILLLFSRIFYKMKFTNPHISIATLNDSNAIVTLLNAAYRGEISQNGWTTEAHLIAGNTRTNLQEVAALIQLPNVVFLKYTNAENNLIGCVNLQLKEQGIYLGMFSVHPLVQAAGIGKQILQAAEEYAQQQNVARIYMTVIDVRKDLIAWYERRGYTNTNQIIPFEQDAVSGTHLQKLQFTVLEKLIQ